MNNSAAKSKEKSVQWLRLLIGLILVFGIFQWTATALESDRGQFGGLVGLLVVTATVLAEKLLFNKSFKDSIKAVGIRFPNKIGFLTVSGICLLIWLTIFIFALATNSRFDFYPNWYLLVSGLFFQAGVAEEILFRGYLFGRIREKYTFWKAAILAAFPFILVHLILFYSLPWAIAVASILLSILLSFPFARLFELDGSIWAPAILHFVVQGTIKILIVSGESANLFPIFWMAVCAVIPWIVFVVSNNSKSE